MLLPERGQGNQSHCSRLRRHPSQAGRSTDAIGVSHLSGGCTESHDLLPNVAANADVNADADEMLLLMLIVLDPAGEDVDNACM